MSKVLLVEMEFYNKTWYVVNDWKINRRIGVITHKAQYESVIRHQYINGIDLSIVRCEFNIVVIYTVIKFLVLLKRARKRIVKWMCLRNIYKKNNCALFNNRLRGFTNLRIRKLILHDYL